MAVAEIVTPLAICPASVRAEQLHASRVVIQRVHPPLAKIFEVRIQPVYVQRRSVRRFVVQAPGNSPTRPVIAILANVDLLRIALANPANSSPGPAQVQGHQYPRRSSRTNHPTNAPEPLLCAEPLSQSSSRLHRVPRSPAIGVNPPRAAERNRWPLARRLRHQVHRPANPVRVLIRLQRLINLHGLHQIRRNRIQFNLPDSPSGDEQRSRRPASRSSAAAPSRESARISLRPRRVPASRSATAPSASAMFAFGRLRITSDGSTCSSLSRALFAVQRIRFAVRPLRPSRSLPVRSKPTCSVRICSHRLAPLSLPPSPNAAPCPRSYT